MAKLVHRGQWQIEKLKSKIKNMGAHFERVISDKFNRKYMKVHYTLLCPRILSHWGQMNVAETLDFISAYDTDRGTVDNLISW